MIQRDVLLAIEMKAERAGYTLRELFNAAGIDWSNWSRWRNGVASPTLRSVEELMRVPSREDRESVVAAITGPETPQ